MGGNCHRLRAKVHYTEAVRSRPGLDQPKPQTSLRVRAAFTLVLLLAAVILIAIGEGGLGVLLLLAVPIIGLLWMMRYRAGR